MDVCFRNARRADLPRILELLAADSIASSRETPAGALTDAHEAAFAAIAASPDNDLIVVERAGEVIGVLQFTVIPGLTYQGGSRALIEAVRVASACRSRGIGQALVEHAIDRARSRGCRLVQLTTDRRRESALRFYERLGFVASHNGMKLRLD